MKRYRVKHAHIKNLWIAYTHPKQLARDAHLNTTSTASNALSYKSKEKAEAVRQQWISLQIEHNKHRPKGMPKPLDPKTCFIVEEYQ